MQNKWKGVRRDVCPVGFNWKLSNKPPALVVLNSLLSHHGLYLYQGSVHNMKYAVAFRCKVFVPGSRDFVCLHFPKLPRACIPRYTHTNHEPILKVVK